MPLSRTVAPYAPPNPLTREASGGRTRRTPRSSYRLTTRSKPTTASSNVGCDRCAGSRHDRTAQVVIAGHAFVQNLDRGHYELGLDAAPGARIAAAFAELARAIDRSRRQGFVCTLIHKRNRAP